MHHISTFQHVFHVFRFEIGIIQHFFLHFLAFFHACFFTNASGISEIVKNVKMTEILNIFLGRQQHWNSVVLYSLKLACWVVQYQVITYYIHVCLRDQRFKNCLILLNCAWFLCQHVRLNKEGFGLESKINRTKICPNTHPTVGR